jgi:predicted MFS family arabinose efflux permease
MVREEIVPDARRAGSKFPRRASFWLLAVLLALFLFAASAPSPLYAIYQAKWGFSSITLTAIYAVYALGALAALLITGRLSDHVGRRRVVTLALAVQIAGLWAFIAAQGAGMLYVGRTLQGVGTGIATGAISAWLLDLQPPEDPRLGSLVGGIAPIAGLAAGGLGSALLVAYGPDPLRFVFWLLAAVFLLALAAMPFLPDPARRKPGWLRSMIPQIGVPADARSLFAALVPSLIAIWALGGLYLSLGPSLAISLLDTPNSIAGGLVIGGLMGAAAVASGLVRNAEPRVILIRGSLVFIGGVAITLFAVAMGSIAGLYAGSVIAGLGFGPAFSGIFRSLAPLASPDKRGALIAAIYIVLYPSFSIPAIVAGVAVTYYPLPETTYVFGSVVMALVAVTAVTISRRPAAPSRR